MDIVSGWCSTAANSLINPCQLLPSLDCALVPSDQLTRFGNASKPFPFFMPLRL